MSRRSMVTAVSRISVRVLMFSVPVLMLSILFACGSEETQDAVIEPQTDADLVLHGGKIYTVNDRQTWAQAVAIKDGRFVYVGDDAGVQRFVGERTQVSDLGSKLVIPGLVDAHTHPGNMGHYGAKRAAITATDHEEVLAQVAEYADAHPDVEWIIMAGFPVEIYGKTGPHRRELDRVVSDRPVYLVDNTGHSRWFNSRALEIMGLDRNTPDAAPKLSWLRAIPMENSQAG